MIHCSEYNRNHVCPVTWSLLSCFERKLSVFCQRLCSLCPNFFFGLVMSQVQILLSVFNFKTKFGILAVVDFLRWNSKFHTSFVSSFSNTNSCRFAQATAVIISARLCLVRYSLFASLVHPATRCFTISECWVHILHVPLSVIRLDSFHDLVSTMCSNIVIIAAVFPGLRFWDNHT